jgi:hypothetical protein
LLCVVSAALSGAAARAADALGPASSAEFQALLAAQEKKSAVTYDQRTLSVVPQSTYQRLFAWNEEALDTTAIDHTPPGPNAGYVFGQQFGPTRSARAMAIVHIAMFEAVNAVYRRYRSYAGIAPAAAEMSVDYAIAQSAHDALVWLYPSQRPRLDAVLASDVANMSGKRAALDAGQAMGKQAAAAIIAMRVDDGAEIPEPTVGEVTLKTGVGYWSPDPVSRIQTALGYYWPKVKPFVLTSAAQFRAPPPPALNSAAFARAYDEVKAIGGDPTKGTPSTRTAIETQQGTFWSYDGVPNLCAPPRLYNQIARMLAFQQGLADVEDAARYLALINTAMADAALAAWDGKWFYQFWRPVVGIRKAGETGVKRLTPDPKWYPLGAQATNSHGPNFTPPFPAYPSGHATIGGSMFEMLRQFWPDATKFIFVSDEFNGQNYNDKGKLLPLEPVRYTSFSQAEYDNMESRVWIGVHWQFDADAGDAAGRDVADWVITHAFLPMTAPSKR